MPVTTDPSSREILPVSCARCHTTEANIVVRTEHLCRECFMKYVVTKILKRLETKKLRGGYKDPQRTLLMPISFGISSIVMLHVIDQQLSKRVEAGRHAGYNLHVLFVDQSAVIEQASPNNSLHSLKQRYPSHTYTVVALEDYCTYGIHLDIPAFAEAAINGHTTRDKPTRLEHILSSLPSATSRADLIEILRRRLILAFAKAHACDSILFGDATTRLAEKTLSETAKGRGIALPWLTADGSSSDGIDCTYPLRDLLRKELGAYANIVSPPLTPLLFKVSPQLPTSSKENTIDSLMSQYFESVEQNYPSIVANVVRTSGRLVVPPSSENSSACVICGHPIVNESWDGDQLEFAAPQLTESNGSGYGKAFCYGCARTARKL